MDILDTYRRALDHTIAGIAAVRQRAGEGIVDAADLLYGCRGRVVLCGVGKCGHVAQKIAATFSSTGAPALYLHPAEALHGDLGAVTAEDVAIVISNSGETPEIAALLPHLHRLGVPIIAITGRPQSTLGRHAQAVIDSAVPREADPLDLAPTASTSAMLAIGDALAAVLMERRRFSRDDYAVFHPGGALGQKLLCLVDALMHRGDELPLLAETGTVGEALFVMTAKRLGACFLVDARGRLTGILTDGDLRRTLQRDGQPLDLPVNAVMTQRPKSIAPGISAYDALRFMEDNLITVLPVVDERHAPVGAVHIHDLIRAGIG